MPHVLRSRFYFFSFLGVIVLALILRVWGLNTFPPSLYWEEVALGYDAYSILKTGKDHHGTLLPLVAFESFGDWKPSLYFYAVVPFILVFDVSLWAVRAPSVLSGLAIVWGTGLLTKLVFLEMSKADLPNLKKVEPNTVQLLGMLVAAVSPWAIQFSRGGWEVNLATALMLLGVLLFWDGSRLFFEQKTKTVVWQVVVGAVLLGISMYAYHAARIVAPLLGLGLAATWTWRHLHSHKRTSKDLQDTMPYVRSVLMAGVVTGVVILPILASFGTVTTTQRFAETSIFSDLAIIERSNTYIEHSGGGTLSKLLYHRYLLFGQEIILNGLSHFDLGFLFVHGDVNPRHSVQYVGQLYHIEFFFVLAGLYVVSKAKFPHKWLLGWWMIVGVLPAAITKSSPHALRILPTLPVFLVLITLGLVWVVQTKRIYLQSLFKKYLSKPKEIKILSSVLWAGVGTLYALELLFFFRFYERIYPKLYAGEWQAGYQEMIQELQAVSGQYPEYPVFLSREQGRPLMYYWFFTKTDPKLVQAASSTAKKDQSELLEFENIQVVPNGEGVTQSPAIVANFKAQTQAWEVQVQ